MPKKMALLLLPLLLSGCSVHRLANNYHTLRFPPLKTPENTPYVKQVFPNGLTVLLMEDNSLPLINFHAMITTGAIYDPKDKRGLAEMSFELIRTGGAGQLSGDEIDETLEHIGAQISCGVNWDLGWIGGLSDTENFNRVFSIFTDMLKNPSFEEDKIALSKIRKNSEILRRNDDIDEISARLFRKLLYGEDSPYARTIEYETVKSICRQDMIEFHRRFVRPQNIILGVWGDFKSSQMLEYLKESIGNWTVEEPPPLLPLPEISFPNPTPSINLAIKKDASQSVIIMGHIGLRRDDPDYFTALVLSRILGTGWHSRFSRNIRQQKGLAYSAWAGFWGEFGYPGPFYGYVQTQSERTFEAVELMQKEIRLILEGATPEEISVAKEGIINNEVFWSDTREKIMHRLMTYEYYGYPVDYPQKLIEGIKKVTAQDIISVAKKHILPDHLTVLIVGNPEKFGCPLPEGIKIIEP